MFDYSHTICYYIYWTFQLPSHFKKISYRWCHKIIWKVKLLFNYHLFLLEEKRSFIYLCKVDNCLKIYSNNYKFTNRAFAYPLTGYVPVLPLNYTRPPVVSRPSCEYSDDGHHLGVLIGSSCLREVSRG